MAGPEKEQGQTPKTGGKGREAVLTAILVVVSLAFGFVFAEAAFRGYLYYTEPAKFMFVRNLDHPEFGVYDKSHWEFDRDFGFNYPPGRVIAYTHIKNGRVTNCLKIDTINKRGNIGRIKGTYADADLKVLVFGDSFPAFTINYHTFPSKLQKVLSERLGKKVHVVNFGRDGYGILQMFDLAATKIPEWKPDLVIFTFITDDLTRVRIWRTSVEVNGEPRILTTIEPNPNPSVDRSQDTFVRNPAATLDWCKRVRKHGGTDPLVRKLEFAYRRMAREAGYWFPDPLSLTHSFLLARLIYRDPYRTSQKQESFFIPKITYDDYSVDKRFMGKVAAIQKTKVPYVLVHLPIYPEIIKGKEMVPGPHDEALWKSLEKITRHTAYRLTNYLKMPLKDAEKMNASPTNFHPSPWGMDLYANAIAEALIRNGVVGEKP